MPEEPKMGQESLGIPQGMPPLSREDKIAVLLQGLGAGAGMAGGDNENGPQQVSPAQVGQLPGGGAGNLPLVGKNIPPALRAAMSGPGATPLPGPAAHPIPETSGYDKEYSTREGRDAAIVGGAINNITQAITRFKQMKAEKQMGAAEGLTARLIAAYQTENPELIKKTEQEIFQNPKAMKIFEKAWNDPTSREANGISQAVNNARNWSMQQLMDKVKMGLAQQQIAQLGSMTPEQMAQAARIQAGLEPGAEAKLQSATQKEVAQIRGMQLTKGTPVQGPDGTYAVPWYDKQGNLVHYTTLEGTPAGQVPKETTETRTSTPTASGGTATTTTKVTKPVSPKEPPPPSATKALSPTEVRAVKGNAAPQSVSKNVASYKGGWEQERLATTAALGIYNGRVYKNKYLQSQGELYLSKLGLVPGIKPSSDALNRGTFADQLVNGKDPQTNETKFEHVYKLIDKLDREGQIGPLKGRLNYAGAWKIGLAGADYVALQSDLELLAGGAARAHFGGRSGLQTFEKFDGMFAKSRTADDMRAALRELESTLRVYAQIMQLKPLPGAAPTTPEGQPAAPAAPTKPVSPFG